jgi:hypothetical protein
VKPDDRPAGMQAPGFILTGAPFVAVNLSDSLAGVLADELAHLAKLPLGLLGVIGIPAGVMPGEVVAFDIVRAAIVEERVVFVVRRIGKPRPADLGLGIGLTQCLEGVRIELVVFLDRLVTDIRLVDGSQMIVPDRAPTCFTSFFTSAS